MSQTRRSVLLLIESSRAYGRGCLLGIAAYLRSHPDWHAVNVERGLAEQVPRFLSAWSGDGILARIESKSVFAKVESLGLPTVDLRGSYTPKGGATFDTDAVATAKLAADHFLSLGFRRFAYCGFAGVDFSMRREEAFRKVLSTHGCEVVSYASGSRLMSRRGVLALEARGELEEKALSDWLRSLTKPIAILACNDVRGRQVLDACRLEGIAVPEEAAVLGVDDDEVICGLSSPPLSSVQPDAERIGYEGAATLDAMMRGQPPPDTSVLIPPRGLCRRRSTETSAIEDPEIAAAMRYIRERACQGLTVGTLVKRLAISRSTLERRFLDAFDRTPAQEIERVRDDRAKLLLCETEYKLARIAALTGYSSTPRFAASFKHRTGMTPGGYRKSFGNR